MSSRNSQKFTEDWVPVQSITNGTIVLDNKELVTGIKIIPRNIFIMDYDGQANVITALRNFYNTIDFEFWLIVADRPVDINVYLSQLQLQYSSTQDPVIRKMLNEDMNKINMFVSNNVVDTEYYILFKEKKPELIQKKMRTLLNGIYSCGLNAMQTSNDDLRVILDNFLNGGMKTEFGTVITSEL